ncbi:hypothetical protein [Thomasclavelia spiroformis]|jgi:hypothetical protein|uniref:hypothetical protein n=1 Tax=Thomasclavelia spiroformis TaxID=29348 RepID=UPI002420184E|nr:hypothetical protein [Thomasclavelia spiroformis]
MANTNYGKTGQVPQKPGRPAGHSVPRPQKEYGNYTKRERPLTLNRVDAELKPKKGK